MKKHRILITVMTYPHPSVGSQEVVCTAGITEDGQWARLYPIDYRYREEHQKFQKYQWIEVDAEAPDRHKDPRPESLKPDVNTIRIDGEPISTKDKWFRRREIIDAMPHFTGNELKEAWERDRTSLGIVRPERVIDLEIRPVEDSEWKPAWKKLFSQSRLFGPDQKPLRKLPFTFHYHFECSDSDKPQVAMCEDWELGVLFLKQAVRLGSDEKAAESVRDKFLNEICAKEKDTRFFMGTRHPYNTWLVLGVFYPPHNKHHQRTMF